MNIGEALADFLISLVSRGIATSEEDARRQVLAKLQPSPPVRDHVYDNALTGIERIESDLGGLAQRESSAPHHPEVQRIMDNFGFVSDVPDTERPEGSSER